MSVKRLFVFAGYDPQGVIDNTLLHYLRSLSVLGDIVLVMDCDISSDERKKLNQVDNLLYFKAERHKEYDFGSYKRGFQYARNKKILKKYDWVYFVNDSVYGPLFDIEPILLDLESRGADLIGMADFMNKPTPIQVQSWFVGVSKEVANSEFLSKFFDSVCSQVNKQLIVLKYEVGLSQVILHHGYKMDTWISGEVGEVCHSVYENPIGMLKQGLPFVKKAGLKNTNGLQYLYPYTTDKIVDDISKHAKRTGVLVVGLEAVPEYEKFFRLTILSLPIILIKRQVQKDLNLTSYKLYLFDKLPVCKLAVKK